MPKGGASQGRAMNVLDNTTVYHVKNEKSAKRLGGRGCWCVSDPLSLSHMPTNWKDCQGSSRVNPQDRST